MIPKGAVLGKDAAVATLRERLHEAERGSLNCIALRVYRVGGGSDDLVLGGTAEEQAKALSDFLAMKE
ncbi:hypothetical protein [Variovorax sp. EBFNA2]|jgi:hypothetical protein|uniref:hypothetical protein n=1 Tax=Variovorax sp. EBFNA2 TaxID=3342097 RepID=UPI0029C06FA0|nr:hypothetical protein [Variovorax boronicumulans]WPG40977.1 hypothetical protein RZE79_33295 [Variovorax boronicumulans]